MDYSVYVKPELLPLILALIGLGAIIKKTKLLKDKYIPLVLTGISLALSCLYVLGTEGVSAIGIFTAVIQGLLVAAGAVYSNQLAKQLFVKK